MLVKWGIEAFNNWDTPIKALGGAFKYPVGEIDPFISFCSCFSRLFSRLKFTAFGSKKLAQKTVKMGCLLVK